MNLLEDPLNVKHLRLVGLANVKVKLVHRGTHYNGSIKLSTVKVLVVHELLYERTLARARFANHNGKEVRLQVLALLLG